MCGRNFFAFRLLRCSGHPCNNEQSYGQMDVAAGFRRSEKSRNNFGRHSNCSGRLVYGKEKWISHRAWPKHTWLLPFYTYPANCLALYLLSSMAFTATVCQVYVSESVGTEVQWLWWFQSGMRITTLQSIDQGLCLPANVFMDQEGKCQPA